MAMLEEITNMYKKVKFFKGFSKAGNTTVVFKNIMKEASYKEKYENEN